MAKVPRWIAKATREARHEELEGVVAMGTDLARPGGDETVAVLRMADGTVVEVDRELMAATFAPNRRRTKPPLRPWLERSPHDYPPKGDCTLNGELWRLLDAQQMNNNEPVNWHSPLRNELRQAGLIRLHYDGDGRWIGDTTTSQGRRRLRL